MCKRFLFRLGLKGLGQEDENGLVRQEVLVFGVNTYEGFVEAFAKGF